MDDIRIVPADTNVESLLPYAPLANRGIDSDWCIACDGIESHVGFGWTKDRLHYFCAACRDDYDDPNNVLNPRPVVVDQQRAVFTTTDGTTHGDYRTSPIRRSSQSYVDEMRQKRNLMRAAYATPDHSLGGPMATFQRVVTRHRLDEPIEMLDEALARETQRIVQDAAESELEPRVRAMCDKVEEYCRDNGLPIPPEVTQARETLSTPKDDIGFDVRTPSKYATLGLCQDCCDLVEEYEMSHADETIPVAAFCTPDVKKVARHSVQFINQDSNRLMRVTSVQSLQHAIWELSQPIPRSRYTIAEQQSLERDAHDTRKRA